MQRVGEEFLAGAALADEQDAGAALGHPQQGRLEFAHRLAVADDAVDVVVEIAVLGDRRGDFGLLPHQGGKLVGEQGHLAHVAEEDAPQRPDDLPVAGQGIAAGDHLAAVDLVRPADFRPAGLHHHRQPRGLGIGVGLEDVLADHVLGAGAEGVGEVLVDQGDDPGAVDDDQAVLDDVDEGAEGLGEVGRALRLSLAALVGGDGEEAAQGPAVLHDRHVAAAKGAFGDDDRLGPETEAGHHVGGEGGEVAQVAEAPAENRLGVPAEQLPAGGIGGDDPQIPVEKGDPALFPGFAENGSEFGACDDIGKLHGGLRCGAKGGPRAGGARGADLRSRSG